MPIGAFRQSLNLANPVSAPVIDYGIFRGFVRSASTTTVNAYNTAGTALGTAFTHSCGTIHIIRTKKLPNSNDQIIAIGGTTGRRVLHFNAATNVFTSIYSSTAYSTLTTCDITYNTTYDKFYVAWGANQATTTNRVRLSTGTLSSPTSAMTEAGLSDPGAAVYSCCWTPNGNTLAVRTANTIRTYYRASGDVMTLNATTYSLAGGVTGNSYEDSSWNADGTVFVTGQDSNLITRYSLGTNGALTSLGNTTVSTAIPTNSRSLPAFNPNPDYANVMAVAGDILGGSSNSGWTLMYFASGGSGSLTSNPGGNVSTASINQIRQVRWSPAGDRIVALFNNTTTPVNRYYSFTYSEGSTATTASGGTFSSITPVSDYSFDWIYY